MNQFVYETPDSMPKFPGGEEQMLLYVRHHLHPKVFIAGSTNVEFVVDTDGTLRNVEMLDEAVGKSELGKEIVRVFRSMPNWKPGIFHGRNVAVSYGVPLRIDWETQR